MISWAWLFGAILFNVAGNLLMKKFALTKQIVGPLSYVDPFFVVGGVLFGLNLLLYAKAIHQIPLIAAYPVLVGSSVVFVTLGSMLWFSERVSSEAVMGMALIAGGIVLITTGSSK